MIRFEYFGSSSELPTILAIPGIDGSIGSIEPIVCMLAQHRCVAVLVYTDERYASLEDLAAAISARADCDIVPPFDVLGQSIGTILAAQVAKRSSARVRRVVLISTFTKLRWNWLRLNNLLVKFSPRWLYRATTRPVLSLVCGPVLDGGAHPFFRTSRDSDPAQVRKRTQWEIGRDFTPDLLAVSQPTLILMGEEDRFVPNARVEAAKLRTICSGRAAKVVTLSRTGHVLLPSASIVGAAEEIEQFLNQES